MDRISFALRFATGIIVLVFITPATYMLTRILAQKQSQHILTDILNADFVFLSIALPLSFLVTQTFADFYKSRSVSALFSNDWRLRSLCVWIVVDISLILLSKLFFVELGDYSGLLNLLCLFGFFVILFSWFSYLQFLIHHRDPNYILMLALNRARQCLARRQPDVQGIETAFRAFGDVLLNPELIDSCDVERWLSEVATEVQYNLLLKEARHDWFVLRAYDPWFLRMRSSNRWQDVLFGKFLDPDKFKRGVFTAINFLFSGLERTIDREREFQLFAISVGSIFRFVHRKQEHCDILEHLSDNLLKSASRLAGHEKKFNELVAYFTAACFYPDNGFCRNRCTEETLFKLLCIGLKSNNPKTLDQSLQSVSSLAHGNQDVTINWSVPQ